MLFAHCLLVCLAASAAPHMSALVASAACLPETADDAKGAVTLLQQGLDLQRMDVAVAPARQRGPDSLVKQSAFTKTSKIQTSIEYVALQPDDGRAGSPLQWVEVSYPTTLTSASDVQFRNVTASDLKDVELNIGALNALPVGEPGHFALTARLFGEHLYGYIDTNGGVLGGCCADTMRKYSKSNGNYTDIDILSPLRKAFRDKNTSAVTATHSFDITEFNGQVYALMVVQYLEPEINAHVDAFVALSMEDGTTIQKTADGDEYFSVYDKLGTLSTAARSSIYKIQYYNNSGGEFREEFHENGIHRFSTASGTPILVFSQAGLGSATLLSDPYSVAAASGGGAILQRFGTPALYKADGNKSEEYHTFGIEASSSYFTDIHNVFYSRSRTGLETITMFVNGISKTTAGISDHDDYSWVYEFELNLVPETVGTSSDEAFWETAYYSAALPLKVDHQGGARPIGMHGKNHVWLIAAPSLGLFVLDQSGGFQSYGSTLSMYDPFEFVPLGRTRMEEEFYLKSPTYRDGDSSWEPLSPEELTADHQKIEAMSPKQEDAFIKER